MKKIFLIAITIAFTLTVNAQHKKWKSIFGFEFGLPFINITPSVKAGNPLMQGNGTLKSGFGICGGVFSEFMKARKHTNNQYGPGGGLKLRIMYNQYESSDNSVSDGESFKMSYISGSLVYKICLSSGEVDIPSSKDDDEISIKQRDVKTWDVTYQEGKTHAGYRTVRSFFLYSGAEYSNQNNLTYSSDNTNYVNAVKPKLSNLNKNDVAIVAGMEAWLGRIYLDLSYKYGLQSFYKGADLRLRGVVLKMGVGF